MSTLVTVLVMLAGTQNYYILLQYQLSLSPTLGSMPIEDQLPPSILARAKPPSTVREAPPMPSVRYVGGVYGSSDAETEELARERCSFLTPVMGGDIFDLQCSGNNVTSFSCCYCFHGYPDFVWQSQVTLLPPPENGPTPLPEARYWFCAEPMEGNQSDGGLHWSYQPSSAVALVTGKLGHGNRFKDEVAEHCDLARAMRIFAPDRVFCYSETPHYMHQDPRFVRHLQFQTDPDDVSARGGGYWFHKAVAVLHHSYSLNDGDYIVWTDVDRADFFRTGTLHTLLYAMEQRGADLVIETMGDTSEDSWTKEDVLLAFNASSSIRSSDQVLGNAWIVRNSPTMRKFLVALIDCASDWHMLSDAPSVFPNGAGFVEHRHDQSILGLLIKQFLIKHATAVGPPARAYQPQDSAYFTFSFDRSKDSQEPSCPFAKFYEAQTAGNRFVVNESL